MTKDGKIKEYLEKPIEIGELIEIRGHGSQNKQFWGSATVIDIIDGVPYIEQHKSKSKVTSEWRKSIYNVGVNPFESKLETPRSVNFGLDSIVHKLYSEKDYDLDGTPIKPSNNNPFVILNEVKQYYQRPLVWTLQQNQNLIQSIYEGIDCGKILVRLRSWDELRDLKDKGHELAFTDIVDGKQRLNAVNEFLNNKFSDIDGNFFDDLSKKAQNKLLNNQLFSYSELQENTPDDQVIKQFLKLNFTGVPQSEEHLQFVKSLLK